MRIARRLSAPAAALAAALLLWGCGEDGEQPPTAFQAALGTLGEGVSVTGSGFGWTDLDGVRGYPVDPEWGANALGPGADDLLDRAGEVFTATGFDPSSANAALAIGGSYALGVRFDGAEPGRLAALLRRHGASSRELGDWTVFDLGNQAEGESRGPLAPLGALASRVATGPEGVVLARFDGARSSLIAERGSLLGAGAPSLELASDCLGDVVAARLIPRIFTHNPAASPDLIAIGVGPLDDGLPAREILCTVDESERTAESEAAALERTLAPGATDPLTGEAILREASVSGESEQGLHLTRAELDPAEGAQPGFLFDAFVRGSLLIYLGAQRPAPRGP